MDRERKIHDVTFSWISFYKKKKKKIDTKKSVIIIFSITGKN